MGDRNTQYLDIPQIEDLGDVDGAPATLASREGAPEKTLSFETKHYAPSEAKEAAVGLTEEDQEADLALLETFTLGIECARTSDSENEHSDVDGRAVKGANHVENVGDGREPTDILCDQAEVSPQPPGRGAEGDEQVTASRRPQSPVTQAVESQFRKMMQGITSSIDAAAASLELSLREAQQHLARDLGDSEGDVVKQIQGIQTEFSRKACAWLARFEDAGLDHGHIDGFDLRLAEANGRCRDVVAEAFQSQCIHAEQKMKGIVDEVVGAFNGHLESAASAAKLHFRWVKRRYRQKIDVNRVAARIELKDTLLLDRCILEETLQDKDSRHREENDRLRVEFQLERSDLRKQRRELEQSLEVLNLQKLQAEQDAAQAHRYIETLENEGDGRRPGNHSDDGSVRSHRHSPRSRSPRGQGFGGSRGGSRGGSPRNTGIGGNSTGVGGGGSALSSRRGSVLRAGGGVGAGNNVGTARNAFVMGGAGHPLHSARGPASARGIGKVRYNSKGSVPAAGGVVSDQHSARGVLGQENTRGQRGGGESGQDSGRLSGRNTSGYYGGSGWPDATSNPAVRHEEALQKFERDVANKLMAVIDRKKLANLQEELADESKNRQAAQARLQLMEQAIPKLHEDLKKAQEQLVQSRMETNELRKINSVLTSDVQHIAIQRKQDEEDARNTNAVALLDNTSQALREGWSGETSSAAVTNSVRAFRNARGAVLGTLRFGRETLAGTTVVDTATMRKARKMRQWPAQRPSEESSLGEEVGSSQDSAANLSVESDKELVATTQLMHKEIEGLRGERDVAISEAKILRDEAEERQRVLAKEEEQVVAEGQVSPEALAKVRLDLAILKDVRRDLESRVAKMQVASDENGYLRRRLEAIERTTLKLNLGGASDDLQVLRERLALESKEVLRLRKTADDLQIDKLAMSEAAAKMIDESVPRKQVKAERDAHDANIAALEKRHQEVKTRLEEEVQRLSDFKAEFEHLAESSLHESDSEGCHAEAANPGEQDGKWKQRVKKIQKYAEWQLAEAHAQARRERVEMALKARSHEILMGEMTVLVRGYRHERGRLCETNRRLVQRLAEIEAQPLSTPTRFLSPSHGGEGGSNGRIKRRPERAKPSAASTQDVPQWFSGSEQTGGGIGPADNAPPRISFGAAKFDTNAIRHPAVSPLSPSPLATAAAAVMDIQVSSCRRPKTSTGFERRTRSMAPQMFGATGRTGKEKTSMKVGMDVLARQLRSRLREEFLGTPADPSDSRDRIKDMAAAKARYTTRDPMILGKPLSPVTGSILTNVPLPMGSAGGEATRLQLERAPIATTASGLPVYHEADRGIEGRVRGTLW